MTPHNTHLDDGAGGGRTIHSPSRAWYHGVRVRLASVLLGFGAILSACQDAPTGPLFASPLMSDTLPAEAQRRLGVATYNLYLGADLGPIISAPDAGTAIQQAAIAWQHVQSTDFRIRAGAIARAIAGERPHLVGLNEVSLWQTAGSPAGPFTTQYDFLQLVLDSLAAQGTPYRSVAVNPHFTVTMPINATFSSWVRWTERNAIIARDDLDEETFFVTNPTSVVFQARIPLTLLGQPLPITRGYATVDARFRGKWIRFAAAHLESYNDLVRKAQAAELATTLAGSAYDVVIAGDLNSHRDFAGDSWQILTNAGYTDVWLETMPGVNDYTATFGDDLAGPPTELDHTVDYVLRRTVGTLDGVGGLGEVLGDELGDMTPNGWWPSDHAGIAVVVRIMKE